MAPTGSSNEGVDGPCTNSAGESHCYNCGFTDSHWAHEYPVLSKEQRAQLQVNIEAQDKDGEDEVEEAVGLLQVTLLQRRKARYALDENWGYLDRFLTVTAFKNSEHLTDIHKSDKSLKVNCNAGAVLAHKVGTFGGLQVWTMSEGIANIFLMPKLEKQYRIT